LTWPVKVARLGEAIELARAERERTGGTHRIYRSYLGTSETIAMESEFDSLKEMEGFWAACFPTPEAGAFLEKWHNLIAASATNEVWTLME